jgi:hypothetical protein
MNDDFDRALMEALNEAVPPVALSPGLADRLVARAHRRSRLWKLFLAFFAVSAAFGAVVTTTALMTETDVPPVETMHTGTTGVSPVETMHTGTTGVSPVELQSDESVAQTSQPLSTPTTGNSQVNTTPLKSTAALAGAIALATAQPTAAAGDGYQYIVSGYPAANPKQVAHSASTSLETGAYRIVSAADDLEARYRTCVASNATALRSDEFKAMMIIIR